MPDNVLALHTAPTDLDEVSLGLAVVQAADMLARVSTLDEVRQIHDQAQALRAYVASIHAGRRAENHAIEIVLRAERRFGELVDTLPAAPPAERGQGRRGKSSDSVKVESPRAAALASVGVSQVDASRCRKLAQVPEEKFEAHVRNVQSRGEKLTRAGTIAAVSHGSDYDSDDWGTPREIVELVRRVLGEIDLDPATSVRAQSIVKAKRYYTVEDDGLARTWKGRVFCNPPYSQPACGKFVAKFIDEVQSGRVTKGIMLLNASTDTRWFHDLASRYPVCFTSGRLGFSQPDGTPVEANRVGQAFFAANCGREFTSLFSTVGIVLSR